MEVAHAPAPSVPPAPAVRLPASVYLRRRIFVALLAATVVVVVLALGRPDGVPPGETNLWPSVGEVTLPPELPGVYIVQPGDTLWAIARSVAPETDPRAVVQELAEAAGGAALEPGQEITIDTAAATALLAPGSDQRPAQQIAAQAAGSGAAAQQGYAGAAGADR